MAPCCWQGLSDAVLALFELGNRIGRLAGLTERVAHLLHGLETREPVLEVRSASATNLVGCAHGPALWASGANCQVP